FFKVVTPSKKTDENQSSDLEQIEDRSNDANNEVLEVNNVNDETEAAKGKEKEVQEFTFGGEISTFKEKFLLSNDAATWPVPMPDDIRLEIIQIGSSTFQNKDGPFLPIERVGESTKGTNRSLTSSWFYASLPDGTKFLRKWMVFSLSTNKLYCFCCRIFATDDDLEKKFVSGFDRWWKLNPKVTQHESSNEHLSNFEKWKTLTVRLHSGKTIDHSTEKVINSETKKWRDILHRLLDITLFLAKQNLSFRGHREDFESENRGNFLELIKLMARYDPVLREHWTNLEKSAGGPKRLPSYLSKGIQNEFINILGDHVLENIIVDVKKAKYYGMLFDSTPDSSHVDQMSKII
ncbi:zinc finger MYM-type protein 1-like, partial [Daktulosphaira vitifoliae]